MLIDRRNALRQAAGVLACSVLPATRSEAAGKFSGRTLVFASWGGVYQNAQRQAFCVPFTRKTGAKIVQDGPVSAARLRVMLDSGSIDWDVVVGNPAILFSLGNRLEKVDTSIVDLSQVPPRFRWEHGVSCDAGAMVLAYSMDAFHNRKAPGEWQDLFDLKRYPGKRMLPGDPRFTLETALLADGVPPHQLYPLDIGRALRKLDSIKDKTIFYQSYSQAQQLIVDGVVTCGMMFSSRAFACVKDGARVGVSWRGNLRDFTPIVVPAGGRNQDMAWSLVNESLNPVNQAYLANDQSISPTNFAALKLIRPEIMPWIPTSPKNLAIGVDVDGQYWGTNYRAINKRWQLWKLV
ncbi:extracellular solute-binding protein [Sphingobium sp. H39-3-25]|uniref:extracellular solute-binding protein n=1 Tax=Sphingobium arseniciresistens TaxID=3030834 RepID=UPI0023B9B315|nr:extracellular solute-binding protein [Sphingobium arseniciresistens]